MINLTPIPEKIQKRLFEKMKVLGRETSTGTNEPAKGDIVYPNGRVEEGRLTHAKMATRSTFLRMTSGQKNPVILMGGKLKEWQGYNKGNIISNNGLPGGYDDIYGSRVYQTYSEDDYWAASDLWDMGDFWMDSDETRLKSIMEAGGKKVRVSNKNKRPTPGVKSVDVSFKGGVRALREATISWTCWSWEDLNYLMPHFLAHGKTVMIEWGWVYDKNTLTKLYDFLEHDDFGNTQISANAYENYRNKVVDRDGDFDMMVGIVKNFEFTTREDGGFDCQTILTSVGASILDNPDPNKNVIDPGISYNLSINEDTRVTAEKIAQATKYGGPEKNERAAEKNPLINLNTSVSLKLFIKEIDIYILESLAKSNNAKDFKTESDASGKYTGGAAWIPNKFIAGFSRTGQEPLTVIREEYENNKLAALKGEKPWHGIQWASALGNDRKYWIRWGWFEDNVLSKFLSITSNAPGTPGEPYNPIITQFRSIERVLTTQGKDSSVNESVRIKNHRELQTIDINKYILPGQFYPAKPRKFEGETEDLDGDSEYLRKLATTTGGHFEQFSKGGETIERTEDIYELKDVGTGKFKKGERLEQKGGNLWGVDWWKDDEYKQIEITEKRNVKTGKKEEIIEVVPGKYGFLRNMLINTKLLKQAFGVDGDGKFTVESINVVEAIETLFSLLNQDLNFWNFRIVVDEIDTSRAKIIDEQITNFNFKIPTLDQKSRLHESGVSYEEDYVATNDSFEEGVFFFPVWQSDSMVKRQNITAKIPNAMQLSVMYGSNMDQLKDFANPGSQFSQKEGVAMGGLYNTSTDKHKEGLDIAFRNPITRKIGVKHGKDINDASIPLRPTEGDDIEQFLIDNADILEDSFEERLEKLNTDLKVSAKQQEAFSEEYNDAVPPPFPRDLSVPELELLLKYEKEREFFGFNTGELTKLLGSVYSEDGEMKPRYKKSLHYLTTQHGIYKQANTPLLIPLELELEIDGIGGIYPGNSFHSNYLPSRYQSSTVFQAFDINHRLDSSGWTVTLSGKMRATMDGLFQGYKTLEQLKETQLKNYISKAEQSEREKVEAAEKRQKERDKIRIQAASRRG